MAVNATAVFLCTKHGHFAPLRPLRTPPAGCEVIRKGAKSSGDARRLQSAAGRDVTAPERNFTPVSAVATRPEPRSAA
jgi:hypothetical protein